ncbi:MAG: FAD-dependent oxidoreductase [Chitinophagales bacterium]|nr:FAD-dependent oxidoreductase [Chitinophagales bacterium]
MGILGISIPFQPILSFSNNNTSSVGTCSKPIFIIGAGAAGMTAAYLLGQQGANFQVLEASSTYGGRMKINTSFANFPIPLGAEWLHGPVSILSNIVNDSNVSINTVTLGYNPQDTSGYYENNILYIDTIANDFGTFEDRKFINSSWLHFYQTYILPPISQNITYNKQIVSIDYQNDIIILTDQNGATYEAEKVIITVPLKILKNGVINFSTSLPTSKQNAIQNANVWGGIKVFLKFSYKFYPTFLSFPNSETSQGQLYYYDAAYGQNTSSKILGLFAVGQQAAAYQALTGNALKDYILAELDQIFAGAASIHYISHTVQNWSTEPFIESAYLADVENWTIPYQLKQAVNNKLFFAGEAYNDNDWGAVHNAAEAAQIAVGDCLNSLPTDIVVSATCIDLLPERNPNKFRICGDFTNYTIQIIYTNGSQYQNLSNQSSPIIINTNNLPSSPMFLKIQNTNNLGPKLIQRLKY